MTALYLTVMYSAMYTDTMSGLSLRKLALFHQQFMVIKYQVSVKIITVPAAIFSQRVTASFV
jgi:hypothetical protein